MQKLARHYETIRGASLGEKLMIMFDIDGTILDMRYMIVHVLKAYDSEHGTDLFHGLTIRDVRVHEAEIGKMLDKLEICPDQRFHLLNWCEANFWSPTAVLEAHQPFAGVMEVIRWFQIQPHTFIGLNTGRPESLRLETLRSLNRIGIEYKVDFHDDLLFMNSRGRNDVITSKIAGLHHFRKSGYRIFAFVDNEPENLYAVSEIDPAGRILLLHADTIFKSKRKTRAANFVSGNRYDITQLINKESLPRHIHFVWHGIDSREKLVRFLASNIRWAEFEIALNSPAGEIFPGSESCRRTQSNAEPDPLLPSEFIQVLSKNNKSMKFDLKGAGDLLGKFIEEIHFSGICDGDLWFNGNTEELTMEGFCALAQAFPAAVIQCPIDNWVSLIIGAPGKAFPVLDSLRQWGINRFSISWKTPHIMKILNALKGWGFEVNIYHVPDLESFLKAVLLAPTSITSDFDYPQWKQARPDYTGAIRQLEVDDYRAHSGS